MPDAIKNANKNGFLLPFINGVLNTKTKEFIFHKSENFNTFIIPLNYNKEDTIKNTKFEEFLNSIVNYNTVRLQVLRACLYLIFTNNLSYQVVLYIYGPTATGKSILTQILHYLLNKASYPTPVPIKRLDSKFYKSALINKILLILNEISFYK